eukprot:502908-Pyramimonas_sp.AAC.1
MDRLALEMGLSSNDEYILQVDWLPGSQTHLAVTTPSFVKVYDLSADAISPAKCLSLLASSIAAVSLVRQPSGHPVAL